MNACTIVARNYFPAARLLAHSFLHHHPESSFSVLLLDATAEDKPSEAFEVLSPYEIGIERREVHRMAATYDVKEFATAVKPWLLSTLLSRGSEDVVVYFDPDIEIFAPLTELADLARKHSIVLTPHMRGPLPADGLLPDDLMILQAGIFNLGFIAVGPRARDFLEWWSSKLQRNCLVALDRGLFVDQRWVDLVPVLFDHTILRDPTCNVAYWNLHERGLVWTGDRYEVDNEPLRFFHFSGFDPTRPDHLSAHLADLSRVGLRDHPHLAQLCREYAKRVIDFGYLQERTVPYRFDSLANGVPLDSRIRSIYRDALKEAERRNGTEPPDPFEPESGEAFLEWLTEPVGPGGLTRYLYALYLDRADIRAAFPLVGLIHRAGFLRWIAAVGQHEENIPPALLPPAAEVPTARVMSTLMRAAVGLEKRLQAVAVRHPSLARAAPFYYAIRRTALGRRRRVLPMLAHDAGTLGLEVASQPAPGINAVGYLRAELGIAELARKLISGIERADIPFSTITYDKTVNRQQFPFEDRDAQRAPYDTNLICVNADELPGFAMAAGPRLFAGRYTIGVWFWELEVFPDVFRGAFELVDEVWVGSDFVRRALASATSKPVKTIPLPLEASDAQPIDRTELGLPDAFLFLFSFDFLSIVERKNPSGVVEAFKTAFKPDEGAALVIKSINGEQDLVALDRLRRVAAEHPDIYVMDGYLSPTMKDGLMSSCDCYVSLHRSEGLGLTMAEAMSYGKPVIATGYSGNLTFMDDENAYLVPYSFSPVPAGCDPYPTGALWAEPDLGRAASLMRHVYEDQREARRRGDRARRDIVARYSVDRTAEFIVGRLGEIHRKSDSRPYGTLVSQT